MRAFTVLLAAAAAALHTDVDSDSSSDAGDADQRQALLSAAATDAPVPPLTSSSAAPDAVMTGGTAPAADAAAANTTTHAADADTAAAAAAAPHAANATAPPSPDGGAAAGNATEMMLMIAERDGLPVPPHGEAAAASGGGGGGNASGEAANATAAAAAASEKSAAASATGNSSAAEAGVLPGSESRQQAVGPNQPQLHYLRSAVQRGTHLAVNRSGAATNCTVVSPYNGGDSARIGAWTVRCAGASEDCHVDDEDVVGILVQVGMSVQKDSAAYTVLATAADAGNATLLHLEDPADSTRRLNLTVAEVTAAPVVFQYAVGDRVDVRDKPAADWRPAVVRATTPRLTALVEGWTVAYKWEQTRPRERLRTAPPRTAEEEAAQAKLAAELQSQLESLAEGDRVEVKDEEGQEWRPGTVTSVKPLMVKVDGWKKAHMWQFARRIAEGAEEAAASSAAEKGKDAAAANKDAAGGLASKGAAEKKAQEAPVHIVLTAWDEVCLKATCAYSAGQTPGGDPCVSEQTCNSVSGCAWDEAETPPCRRGLKLGDSVWLAPGTHEQGSLREGEVGLIEQIFEDDEQPYAVRGGYTDMYRYREEEVMPAWGQAVRWAPHSALNPTLSFWRGAAAFGRAPEEQPGASIDLQLKTPPPRDWGLGLEAGGGGGGGTAGAGAPKPPPAMAARAQPPPPPPPPPPPGPTQQQLPPPPPPVGSSPAGGLPPQPPPPALTPPPYVRATRAPRTPKPFALVKLKPKVNIPDPLMVYIPDMPELCGTYKMQKKKHKDMPLYLSNDCETQECVIFMSHGGYWMLGKELQDAQDNRPLCKTLGKAIRAPRSKAEYPNMMGGARGGWHCNTHGKGWEDLDKDHCVETTEEMAKKNLDVTMCKKKEAGSEEAASGGSDDTMMMDMMMMMMAEGSSGGGGGSDAGMMAQGEAAAASPLVDDGTPETRKDVDGALYTFTQFKAYYKGKAQAQWDARAATSNKKVAGRLSLGQSVVAAKDITLGGSVLVPEGTEGVVMSVGKDAGTWKVRFKKEPPIAVTLEGTALKVQ